MSGILKIKISETTDELKGLLKSIKDQKVKERVQVLYWLKSEQVKTENAIACFPEGDSRLCRREEFATPIKFLH